MGHDASVLNDVVFNPHHASELVKTGHSCCGNLTAFSPFSLFISLTCLMSWSSASGLNPGGRCVNARVCYEEIDLFSYCLFEPNYLHSNWP